MKPYCKESSQTEEEVRHLVRTETKKDLSRWHTDPVYRKEWNIKDRINHKGKFEHESAKTGFDFISLGGNMFLNNRNFSCVLKKARIVSVEYNVGRAEQETSYLLGSNSPMFRETHKPVIELGLRIAAVEHSISNKELTVEDALEDLDMQQLLKAMHKKLGGNNDK
jgi:hypothetical protein